MKKRIAVVGGGPGGYVAAIRAAQLGAEVTLVEKDSLGGTCVNRGCIPTKALLQSAALLWQMQRASVFGISADNLSLDFAVVAKRKQEVVKRLADGVGALMRKNKITVISGTGRLVDSTHVQVVGKGVEKTIEADTIIIATGSEPSSVPIDGVDGERVIDSDQALVMEELPKSIVIIGGGVIGLEFAQIFQRMGTAVTVIEMMPQVLPAEDTETAQLLQKALEAEGIEIIVGAAVKRISTDSKGNKTISFTAKDGDEQRAADTVLVAVGRRPSTGNLGLEKLGIALERGRIVVDGRMETNVRGVYAIGDAIGGIMLAHAASAEGRCAAQNAMGIDTQMDYRAVPRCVYTSPELAAVGLTEQDAEESAGAVKVGRFPFRANAKAVIGGEMEGIAKVISDAEYGEILGVGIVGPHATEMIAEAVLAIQMEATVDDLAAAIHAHPTLSEAVMEAALGAKGGSLHI